MAALNRKRDEAGKFLLSKHRSRFERRFDKQAIFTITKVKKFNQISKDFQPNLKVNADNHSSRGLY
jgi:hypothetical protein